MLVFSVFHHLSCPHILQAQKFPVVIHRSVKAIFRQNSIQNLSFNYKDKQILETETCLNKGGNYGEMFIFTFLLKL